MNNALPFSRQIAYACGMMGWSIMINLIGVILIYIYLPPEGTGLPHLITQVAIFGIFNIIAIITASGRLIDAIYDPFIAQFSDRSTNPKGRRIPIMKWAILPSVVFCFLIFYPLTMTESNTNIIWLSLMLVGFYVASTSYIIPYNALLPEIAHGSKAKVQLATWQSVGYVFGIAIASNVFNLSALLRTELNMESRLESLQLAVALMVMLAAIFMIITVLAIDEKKYSTSVPSSVSLKNALKQTLTNRNFMLFIVADFSYFIAVTFITSGLMYFVTVLLRLDESIGNKLMMTLVGVSFLFYPIINLLVPKTGKKILVIISFGILAAVFLGVFFLGKMPFGEEFQIYALIAVAAIPTASLNILPVAILAEIIEEDSIKTGENKEAIYFAVRYFFVKIAQTFGIALFAMMLLNGKDPGNDFGIRLNGILGFVFCLLAAIIFTRFKERRQRDPAVANENVIDDVDE